MKWKDFALGIVAGVAAGAAAYAVAQKYTEHTPADDVLENVKEAFSKEGPIDGSWIVMKPEQYDGLIAPMNVYRGGISRMRDGQLEQFEFLADAKTGTVVNVEQTA